MHSSLKGFTLPQLRTINKKLKDQPQAPEYRKTGTYNSSQFTFY